jgi:hypothetical protein
LIFDVSRKHRRAGMHSLVVPMLKASECDADAMKQVASIVWSRENAVRSQQHISPQTPTGATLRKKIYAQNAGDFDPRPCAS